MSETVRLRILSLGAGVQSTALALMAADGVFDERIDGAIFADTMAEPSAVYQHLAWLEALLPFPVYRVSAGNLRDEIVGAMAGSNRMEDGEAWYLHSSRLPLDEVDFSNAEDHGQRNWINECEGMCGV